METLFCPTREDLLTHSRILRLGACCNCGDFREGILEASSREAPLRPLQLLDPEVEHSSFSPRCRPDNAPNHTALLLHLPEFNRNPPVMRPNHSLLGEQSRGWWEGGWRLKSFVEEKDARVFLCVVARCCSNWCSLHIYGWVLVLEKAMATHSSTPAWKIP